MGQDISSRVYETVIAGIDVIKYQKQVLETTTGKAFFITSAGSFCCLGAISLDVL